VDVYVYDNYLTRDELMETARHLHRKQYLMGDIDLVKIATIQAQEGKSAAEVVRDAVRAYEPSKEQSDPITPELIAFLAGEIKSAIKDTHAINEKVETLLGKLKD
jgi:Arc/MetJ-type ribon-helix-helix transcriptional regulator